MAGSDRAHALSERDDAIVARKEAEAENSRSLDHVLGGG
jgi:hypothetical protein